FDIKKNTAANIRFASCGQTCYPQYLYFYQSFVLKFKFCFSNSARTQSPRTLCLIWLRQFFVGTLSVALFFFQRSINLRISVSHKFFRLLPSSLAIWSSVLVSSSVRCISILFIDPYQFQ